MSNLNMKKHRSCGAFLFGFAGVRGGHSSPEETERLAGAVSSRW